MIYRCEVCLKEFNNPQGFGNHVKQHYATTKEYYDHYLKKNGEGICSYCNLKETFFVSMIKGYRPFCSRSCSKHHQPNSKGWIKKEGYVPWNKGKPMDDLYKQNWLSSIKNTNFGSQEVWNKGKQMDPEFKKKWVQIMKDKTWKPHTAETKRKMRISMIKKLCDLQKTFHPPYNTRACNYFNQMMKETDIFIQHAENFGEYFIKELGYYVDGYDKENNTVYEYDEEHHYKKGKLLDKDISRQEEITNFLGCTFVRIKEIGRKRKRK